MAEAQKKKQAVAMPAKAIQMEPERGMPVAQDRYWRLPVYNSPLDPTTLGQYTQYEAAAPLGQQLAGLGNGPREFIEINQDLPQSVPGEGENMRQTTMKHELAHKMQAEMRGKGGISPDFKGPLPDMGGGVLGWFLDSLKDPARAKEAARAYQVKLDQAIGPHEADAFLLSDTTGAIEGAPQDRKQQEVLRRMQIEELERKGQGKYTPIWKK